MLRDGYKIKRFSSKKDSLETAGKVGLGIGAASGAISGIHYLGQTNAVTNLISERGPEEGVSFKEGMKKINQVSRKSSFKDLFKGKNKALSQIRGLHLDSEQAIKANRDVNQYFNALNHSKFKRGFGKAILISGGLGLAAYGASKMNKDK